MKGGPRPVRGWAIALAAVAGLGCGAGPASGVARTSPSPPTTFAPAAPTPTPTVPPVALTPCETFPQNTYSNPGAGFSVPCPPGFQWETLGSPYADATAQFEGAIVDPHYQSSFPAGVVEITIYVRDASSLTDWINHHIGAAGSKASGHRWDAVSNVADTTAAGVPAIAFDYVLQGQVSPPQYHAVALFKGSNSVLVVSWWAHQIGSLPSIARVGEGVVAGLRLQP